MMFSDIIITIVLSQHLAMASPSPADITQAVQAASNRLGYQPRPKQLEIVVKFVRGHDVFISLPTGSGKSLCYWILPWTFDELRNHSIPTCVLVVVSPLIALIKDQVQALNEKGLTSINVGSVGEDDEDLEEDIYKGKYQVLFFSPECLLQEVRWRDMLLTSWYQEHMIGFVVDEAHCVKKW